MRVERIVFVSLAGNQAQFFARVALQLAPRGISAAVVSYHQPSNDATRATGIACIDGYEHFRKPPADGELGGALASMGYEMPTRAVSHERMAYELPDAVPLLRKLWQCTDSSRSIVSQEQSSHAGRVAVVQELGGFCPVLGMLRASALCGVSNTFLEPSFFRGRLFFTDDTLASPVPEREADSAELADASAYLESARASALAVVPDKDVSHYRQPWRKLFDARNAGRLIEKLVAKHVRGQREEFEHVGGHVRRHLRMALGAQRLHSKRTNMLPDRFVYFPLHVPADVALTLRSPAFVDQLAVVDYLARTVPPGFQVVIKEHPAQVGAVRPQALMELMLRHANVTYLAPTIGNYAVVERASAIVTICSKAGAEALLVGKPVIVLGDAFYREAPGAFAGSSLADLDRLLPGALAANAPRRESTMRFFGAVWARSRPGEIYGQAAAHTSEFADSLIAHLSRSET